MKKSNIRVHLKGGIKSSNPQGANSPDGSSAESTPRSIIDCITDAKLVSSILHRAHRDGISAAAFIDLALRDKCADSVENPQHELESAIQQAKALNALMEHTFLFPGDAGEHSDYVKCGLVSLSSATFTRLDRASRMIEMTRGGAQ